MKASLVVKMGQQLALTPQLQQAIRLLELSTLDLHEEIQQALDSNPMLETEDGSEDAATIGVEGDEQTPGPRNGTADDLEDAPWREQIPGELPVDTCWEDVYQTSASSLPVADDEDWDPSSRNAGGDSLQGHLQWQANLLPMSATDRLIATDLIDAINPQGYLEASCEQIAADLSDNLELDIEADEVEAVLKRIQQLEPTGVGARDLRECLLLQLDQMAPDTPWLTQARVLIDQHLDLLARHDMEQLARLTKLDEAALSGAISLVVSLNPKPGLQIGGEAVEYLVPDIIVRKAKDRWVLELNQEAIPRLRVNAQYAGLVRRADSSADNTYLRDQLQQARWFIKSLQNRNETLMKVASQIVEQQRGFLEYGEEAMKPMVLHDIAEQLGMHESTVSRATTQKYIHTPRGIYELKYFFSSHVGTAEGGECSSTAIRALIKKLIAAEDAKKPLSDSKIAALLEETGSHVARRTVAKYRESLGIASSGERKRTLYLANRA